VPDVEFADEKPVLERKISKVGGIVTIIALVVTGLFLLMAGGCADIPSQSQTSQDQGQEVVSEEDSQRIAADFLRNSPTFRFDGIENTLKLVWSGAEDKPHRWEFHYEFQSRNAGYGDRTGLMLAQVITDHRAQIVVEQGEAVHAVLDGKWDMLRQKIIQ
jgi:hypothetical protein